MDWKTTVQAQRMQADFSFLAQDIIGIDGFKEVIDARAQWIGIEASPGKGPAKRALRAFRGPTHEIIRRRDLAFGTTEPNLLPGGKIPRNAPKRSRSLALCEFLTGETLQHLSKSIHVSPSKDGLSVGTRGDALQIRSNQIRSNQIKSNQINYGV
jgi:hypothetical protein